MGTGQIPPPFNAESILGMSVTKAWLNRKGENIMGDGEPGIDLMESNDTNAEYLLGISVGLEQAAKHMLKESGNLFILSYDVEASIIRRLSWQIDKMAIIARDRHKAFQDTMNRETCLKCNGTGIIECGDCDALSFEHNENEYPGYHGCSECWESYIVEVESEY